MSWWVSHGQHVVGFASWSGLSLGLQFSHQALSCSVVVLRRTRISQNDTSLVAIIYLFNVNSAIGTKAELLTQKACVGVIGEPGSVLNWALMGPDAAVSLSAVSPWFMQPLPWMISGGVTWGDGVGADDWTGVVTWAGLGSWGREAVETRDSIGNEGNRCWDMWWELAAAVRAICESHNENFKLDALKFKLFFFFFSGIPLITFFWEYALFSVGLLAGIASGKT